MSITDRSGTRKIADATSRGLSSAMQSLISLLRVCVLSSIKVAWESRKYGDLKRHQYCTVLGNGPSLNVALRDNEVILNDVDVFCVNMFCVSDYFRKIKPRFYFLVDGAFFKKPTNERHEEQIRQLTEKLNAVDWPMFLVISSSSADGGVLKTLENDNVTVLRMNSTAVDGFRFLRHFFYRMRLGMPRCQTVLNFALSTAVSMRYKTIYLYGADHSWTKDLFVDDDNVVCYGDRHVYNTGLTVIKEECTIAYLLRQFAKMFESHQLVAEYARETGCQIFNCTKGSFVDAYDRIKQ